MKQLFYISLFLFISSCNESRKPESTTTEWIKNEGDQITISENNPVLKALITDEVKNLPYENKVSSVGTIEAIPNHYAEVASPFSGRVIRSYVHIGQKVNAGSPLFEILSSDYLSVQKEYTEAINEVKLAEKKYKRQQDLVKHGVGIQKDLEEASSEYDNKKNAFSSISSSLKVYNAKNPKGTLVISSPISGDVISSKIVTGQFLREDAEPVITITELSKVWISGEVKEKDLRFIKIGDKVSVQVNTYPDQVISGKVYHINDWVSDDTKSTKVLIECNNQDKKLKPGMFATITYSANSEEGIIIPTTALMQKGTHQFLWLQTGENKFKKQNVTTKEFSDNSVKVISGLTPGNTIVTAGGIYLLDALNN